MEIISLALGSLIGIMLLSITVVKNQVVKKYGFNLVIICVLVEFLRAELYLLAVTYFTFLMFVQLVGIFSINTDEPVKKSKMDLVKSNSLLLMSLGLIVGFIYVLLFNTKVISPENFFTKIESFELSLVMIITAFILVIMGLKRNKPWK